MSDTVFGMLIGGTVFTLVVWGLLGWAAINRYRRPEREPVLDLENLQKELDEAFAPVKKIDEKRVPLGASFQ